MKKLILSITCASILLLSCGGKPITSIVQAIDQMYNLALEHQSELSFDPKILEKLRELNNMHETRKAQAIRVLTEKCNNAQLEILDKNVLCKVDALLEVVTHSEHDEEKFKKAFKKCQETDGSLCVNLESFNYLKTEFYKN